MEADLWGPMLSDLVLGRPGVDRAAHLREDRDALAALAPSHILLDRRGQLATRPGGGRLLVLPEGPQDGVALFLGDDAGTARWATVVDDPRAAPSGTEWVGLRQLAARLPEVEVSLATTAVALGNWHAGHTRCPRCGEPTQVAAAGWRRDCPADGTSHFPRTDPAVIALLRDAQDNALLGRSGRWPGGAFSTLAGFVEPGETAEAAVRREILEEVGLDAASVTYLGSQPWPFPASLMLGYHARVADLAPEPRVDGSEIVEAIWVSRSSLPGLCEAGRVRLPSEISIANRLVARWFGAPLPAAWCRW